MAQPPILPAQARRILALAGRDRAAARQALAALPLDAQVALVCESPVARRAELLDLVPSPERVVPRLPPAELCFVAKAVGLADAGWLMEHATEEQITACLDLDLWKGATLEPGRMDAWLAAFVEAGEETLARAARAIDTELLVLHLRTRVRVEMRQSDDDWKPPVGGETLDGQFYVIARREDDDLEDVLTLLGALFRRDYWVYFRLLQGVEWELGDENEEWALRWRSGRLQDLGFPPPDDARRIYARIPPGRLDALPEAEARVGIGEWPLPVWMPSLPANADAERSLFRALAELGPDERRPMLFAFLALANRVAMADELPLGDAETMPGALDKAAELASRGLSHLAQAHGLPEVEVLRRTSLERLFRVGHQLGAS